VEKLLPLVRAAGLTPGAHPLLALARMQQTLLLDTLGADGSGASIDDAVRNAAAVCAGLDAVLSHGHPVRALARAELGKLLAADEQSAAAVDTIETKTLAVEKSSTAAWPPSGLERVRLAIQVLAAAHKELLVGFGHTSEGGAVGREVRATIMRLESEMGVLKTGMRNLREFG
jgi:hypothetical protein